VGAVHATGVAGDIYLPGLRSCLLLTHLTHDHSIEDPIPHPFANQNHRSRLGVATYEFPSDLAWSVPRTPQITSFPSNHGTGRAYGVDFYVARQPTSASDRLTGWISYTWGKAETNAYGRTFLADYDHRTRSVSSRTIV
jgi:hypothetical protein